MWVQANKGTLVKELYQLSATTNPSLLVSSQRLVKLP